MATKVREIISPIHGDRRSCPVCCPRSDRVSESQLWAFGLDHPGVVVLRATVGSESG